MTFNFSCPPNLRDLIIESARQLKGNRTLGARAIDKKHGHAKKGGYLSAWHDIEPTQENAEREIVEILSNPDPQISYNGDKVIDVYSTNGRGLRFEKNTWKFITFLEASLV